MVVVIAQVRAKPGRGDELLADFAEWAEVVFRDEPGTILYSLNRSREDPDLFYAIEQYRDDESLEVHRANLRARGGDFDFFAGPPVIQVLERVA